MTVVTVESVRLSFSLRDHKFLGVLTFMTIYAIEMEKGLHFFVNLTRGHGALPLVEQFSRILLETWKMMRNVSTSHTPKLQRVLVLIPCGVGPVCSILFIMLVIS